MERAFGPYTLIQQIAVGGMAEVHLARTQGIAGFEKYVAIKMIHPNFSEDEQFVQMLIDEAKITVQLAHVNIAQTFDLGRVGTTYYITMEFVEGCDLYKLLRTGSELDIDVPIDVAAFIAKETSIGLDYAHRKRDIMGQPLKIVHRDVSPQNVLISSGGEVKVIDFGIAKASMRAQETQAGVIKGKYYYMSPEQCWGESVDPRTDVFSTGIILYELLTGQMLYLEEDLHLLLDMVREANIAPPTSLRREIPAELEHIVMRALQKRPNDRYATSKEMANDLERFLHRTSPMFSTDNVSKWTRRVLGDEPSAAPEEVMPARDRKALTQGVGRIPLLNTDDEFNDENSIIFAVNEDDIRRRAAEVENQERDIDQITGVVEPDPTPPPFVPEVFSEPSSDLASRVPSLSDETPLPELYPEDADAGDDRTVVSAPPGFGGAPNFVTAKTMATMESSPPVMAPISQQRPRASHVAADEFDAEQTVAHVSEEDRDSERTMAAGPWHHSDALSAGNPEPALSALKPARKSRSTPPKGTRNPNSVLSNLISKDQPARVALSPNSHTDSAIVQPVNKQAPDMRPANPELQRPAQQQGYPSHQQGHQQYQQPQQGQQQYQQPQQGQQQYQQPHQQQPQQGQQQYQQQPQQGHYPQPGYAQPTNSFAQVAGLATNARLAAYNIDELPEAYRLTNTKSKARWLLPIIGFLFLAAGAGAAAYFLITQESELAPEIATLTIVSIPEGAKVSINGTLLNEVTPTTFSQAEIGKSYDIQVDLRGHTIWQKATTLSQRDEKMIARLERIVVTLTVTSEPSDAQVYLNGSKVPAGRTPLTLSDISPDTATSVELRKDGFRQTKRAIDWTQETKKTVNFDLLP